jgi:replication-associated recombination protein RarA
MAYGSKFGTINGHTLFECSSWMQKAIRRGLIDDAMYCAVELEMSNYGEYLWRRLKAIASEDIGMANENLPATIGALYESWSDFQGREQKTDRLFLGHAILLLCLSAKSRVVDNFQIVHYATHLEEPREVPEWAFDMHTARGKREGRDVRHFFEVSAQVDRGPMDEPAPTMKAIQRGLDPWEAHARALKEAGHETAPKVVRKKGERQARLSESLEGRDEG